MSSISVVMPIYIVDEELRQLTRDALYSIQGMYDELIIVDDASPLPTDEFKSFATKFIRNETNLNYIKSANIGIYEVKKNYVCLICNDTRLERGELKDLCDEGYMFPTIINKEEPFWDGAFYCFPRKIGGLYDERFTTYFGDLDKFYKANIYDVSLKRNENVLVWHKQSATTDKVGVRTKAYDKDKKIWTDKWGVMPLKNYLTLIKET